MYRGTSMPRTWRGPRTIRTVKNGQQGWCRQLQLDTASFATYHAKLVWLLGIMGWLMGLLWYQLEYECQWYQSKHGSLVMSPLNKHHPTMIGINGLLDGYYFGWCPIFPSHGTVTNPCNIPRQIELSCPGMMESLAFLALFGMPAPQKNFSGPRKFFSSPQLLCNLIPRWRQMNWQNPHHMNPLRTNPLITWGYSRS